MLRVLVVCLTLVLTGCFRGSGPPAETGDPANRHQRDTLSRQLMLNVTGDIQLDVTYDEHVMQFVHFAPKIDELKAASVATVSTRSPIEYAPGLGLIVGISVVGNYTGDGTYKIASRQFTEGPSIAPSGLSVVRVEIYDLSEKEIPNTTVKTPLPVMSMRLENQGPPCTVVLKKKATEGSLECPEIASEDGTRRIALKMSWGAAG